MYIAIAILVFGFLIIIHEFGHFMAAKAFNVRVVEFSVGMGPRLLKKQGKETLFSLRALPIGGSCLMEGEDEETQDPRSFTAQTRWKRFIILVAGSFMNFLTGAVIVLILTSQAVSFGSNDLAAFAGDFPHQGEAGLMVGDKIISINGERIYYSNDFITFMEFAGGKPVDMVILRNGGKIALNNLQLRKEIYPDYSETEPKYGVSFERISATFGEKLKYTAYQTMNFVRMTRVSFAMLFSGSAGLKDLSGPVGIVSAIHEEIGKDEKATTTEKLYSVANFSAFIAVTLAVMNLLPIPALDGGRIFFMIVTFFIEKIIRRHVDPKYEGYIHTAGFMLLLGLMAVVMVNDVVKLFNG
ncbi:MAG: peptidase M50 [Clostridiales bacterium]|nr:peptidase M50 [Clostridiales bacterium]